MAQRTKVSSGSIRDGNDNDDCKFCITTFFFFPANYEKELRSDTTKQYLLNCSKLISNESKRPGASIYDEYTRMTGSFKKLDLD